MTDEAAKDAFRQLSQEEQGHENLLQKYLRRHVATIAKKLALK